MNCNSRSFFREWSRALVSVALILSGGQDAGAQTETPPEEGASQDIADAYTTALVLLTFWCSKPAAAHIPALASVRCS